MRSLVKTEEDVDLLVEEGDGQLAREQRYGSRFD
jgi:hypothetical protein